MLDRILRRLPAGTQPPAGLVPAARLAARARRDAAAAGQGGTVDAAQRELRAREERLTERFALLQAELGGLFYEMAIRDHVRMDVLLRKAALLQRVDAELAEARQALRPDAEPTTGRCGACGAGHAASARFCGQCGDALAAHGAMVNGVAHTPSSPAPGADG